MVFIKSALGLIGAIALATGGWLAGGAVKGYSNEDKIQVIEKHQDRADHEREEIKRDIGQANVKMEEIKGDVKVVLEILERMERKTNGR